MVFGPAKNLLVLPKTIPKTFGRVQNCFGPLEVQGIWEVTANKSGVILMDVRNYLEVEKTGKLFTVPTKTRWKFIPEANQIKNERTFSSQPQKLQKMLSAEWISPSFNTSYLTESCIVFTLKMESNFWPKNDGEKWSRKKYF